MDTGNNGQMLTMNIESIAEVKILTQGYQAEYGRSSGLQITAVTKSGTNRFRGSAYDLQTDSDWNANTWVRDEERRPEAEDDAEDARLHDRRPGRQARRRQQAVLLLRHEYRPTTTAINSGNPIRLRVPTALERDGDFSQSLDNNGALRSRPAAGLPTTRQPLPGATSDPGEPPVSARASTILNRYPLPNVTPDRGHELQLRGRSAADRRQTSTQQPAVRLDYQLSSKLRVTGKYSGERARRWSRPGTIPGFTDVLTPYPLHHQLRGDGELHDEPDDVHRGHVRIHPQRAGGRQRKRHPRRTTRRTGSTACADFPLLYPDAGVVDQRYYALRGAEGRQPGVLGRHATSTCRRSSRGAAASAPRRRTSAIPAG